MDKVVLTVEDVEYLKGWAKENPDKRFTLHIPFEDVLIETKDPEYPFMKPKFRAKVCLEDGKLPFPFVVDFDASLELDTKNKGELGRNDSTRGTACAGRIESFYCQHLYSDNGVHQCFRTGSNSICSQG